MAGIRIETMVVYGVPVMLLLVHPAAVGPDRDGNGDESSIKRLADIGNLWNI